MITTRSASRAAPNEEEAVIEAAAPRLVSMPTDSSSNQNSQDQARYVLKPPHRPIPTFGESAVSAPEYIRQIRTAWRNAYYTEASKTAMIIDTTTDYIRKLLRLYVPSYNPEEMLDAIIKLHSSENTAQDIITTFYTTQQFNRESFAAFSIRLHTIFEQHRSAQMAEGELPMRERVLNKQRRCCEEETTRKSVRKSRCFIYPTTQTDDEMDRQWDNEE